MNNFWKFYALVIAAIVVPDMASWGNLREIARLNTFWNTLSYNFEKMIDKTM